jgi:hypothetical protein
MLEAMRSRRRTSETEALIYPTLGEKIFTLGREFLFWSKPDVANITRAEARWEETKVYPRLACQLSQMVFKRFLGQNYVRTSELPLSRVLRPCICA